MSTWANTLPPLPKMGTAEHETWVIRPMPAQTGGPTVETLLDQSKGAPSEDMDHPGRRRSGSRLGGRDRLGAAGQAAGTVHGADVRRARRSGRRRSRRHGEVRLEPGPGQAGRLRDHHEDDPEHGVSL